MWRHSRPLASVCIHNYALISCDAFLLCLLHFGFLWLWTFLAEKPSACSSPLLLCFLATASFGIMPCCHGIYPNPLLFFWFCFWLWVSFPFLFRRLKIFLYEVHLVVLFWTLSSCYEVVAPSHDDTAFLYCVQYLLPQDVILETGVVISRPWSQIMIVVWTLGVMTLVWVLHSVKFGTAIRFGWDNNIHCCTLFLVTIVLVW